MMQNGIIRKLSNAKQKILKKDQDLLQIASRYSSENVHSCPWLTHMVLVDLATENIDATVQYSCLGEPYEEVSQRSPSWRGSYSLRSTVK